MSKNIEDFEEFVFPLAPDVPSTVVHHSLRESIANFMQQTQMAKDFFQCELEYNNTDYMIQVPECRTIVEVVRVLTGGTGEVPNDRWEELTPGVDYQTDLFNNGVPSIILTSPLTSNCDSSTGVDISVEYTWSISRDGCDVPDFIYERFMQDIVDGALAYLYSIPDQPFTNLQYAMMLRSKVEASYKTLRSKYRRRYPQPMKMRRASLSRGASSSFWR